MRPSALAVPHPLPLELLRALLCPRDELKPLPFAASSAPPRSTPPSPVSTSLAPLRPAHPPPLSPMSTSELQRLRAGEAPPRPLSAVHRGPALSAVHRTVDSVHGIFR
jgi:hypothetical protein